MNGVRRTEKQLADSELENVDDVVRVGEADDSITLDAIAEELPDGMIENDDGSITIIDDESEEPGEDADQFQANLAELLEPTEIQGISRHLIERIEEDKQSRELRDKQYAEGLKRTGLGNDAPGGADFPGASRVVHPVLIEGCIDFASRAIKELFPPQGPVKSFVTGKADRKKLERAQRKTRFLNWMMTDHISEYRSELEVLLTQLPMGGSQYQKFSYDPRLKRPRVSFVGVDEVYLPFAANDFYTSPRITYREPLTRQEIRDRINSGLYRDVFDAVYLSSLPEFSETTEANDKIEGREDSGYNEDGLRMVLEIYAWMEIESDPISGGKYAPYIITIDEDTEDVLAIYRNWDEEDSHLNKIDWWVEWKFVPWRGAYALGLPHIIGGLSGALTGALRAILDSAHINNIPTGIKLKGSKISGQTTTLNATQVAEIEGPAGVDDIRKLMMAVPFNQPSPVLAGLIDKLYEMCKGVVSSVDDQVLANVGDRTPVGTTMAIIEQGSTIYSAIHGRLHESQKRALRILQRITKDFFDQEQYDRLFGERIVTPEDFEYTDDIIPVSDPAIFSEAQRFSQMQSLLQMSQDQTVPWNKREIYRRMLVLMHVDDVDNVLPADKEPTTADVLTENMMVMEGHPIKAEQNQDHLAHIHGHMLFADSPVQKNNPFVKPETLLGILAHVNEHIQMLQHSETAIQAKLFLENGEAPDVEKAVVLAMSQPNAQFTRDLNEIVLNLGTLYSELQGKMPKPPLPPEVQASLQIAQMDIQRKAEYDKMSLQIQSDAATAKNEVDLKNVEIKRLAQEQAASIERLRAEYQIMFDKARVEEEARHHDLVAKIDLIINRKDNEQKRGTELLKNRDDNLTKLQIAAGQQISEALLENNAQVLEHERELQDVLNNANTPETEKALEQAGDLFDNTESSLS